MSGPATWTPDQIRFAQESRDLKAAGGDPPLELLFHSAFPQLSWEQKMEVVKHMGESGDAWEYPADREEA